MPNNNSNSKSKKVSSSSSPLVSTTPPEMAPTPDTVSEEIKEVATTPKVFRSKFNPSESGEVAFEGNHDKGRYKARPRRDLETDTDGKDKIEKGGDLSKNPQMGTGGRYPNKYPRRSLDTRKISIDFKKPDTLERFISKTGKILPRRVTGASALVQRKISREIKIARHIGLLPYSHR